MEDHNLLADFSALLLFDLELASDSIRHGLKFSRL